VALLAVGIGGGGGGGALGAYLIERGPGRATTYAGASRFAEAATFAAGLALVAAAVVLALAQAPRRSPWVAILAGIAWFAPLWVAWQEGPSIVRSAATAVAFFQFAAVAHLVSARSSRSFLLVAYGEAALAALLLALFRAPFLDSTCWANCTSNSFLSKPLPRFAADVVSADRFAVAALALALITGMVIRVRRASPVGRRLERPAAAAAVAFAAAVAAHELALQNAGVDDPFDTALRVTFVVTAATVFAVAAMGVLDEARAGRTRTAVARAAAQLDAAANVGVIETALAEAFGDRDLRIAYPLGASGRYVSPDGREVPPIQHAEGRRTVHLRRRGSTVAVVEHDASIGSLAETLTPSLLIGLENERLRAVALAQLEELRRSRARIVGASDAERRRLERDLHDGVQQRLLALSYTLRVARAEASADDDERAATMLGTAVQRTETALDQLRDVAHGIYPGVLSEVGIGAALRSLQDTAPLIVRFSSITDRRFDGSVEATAYFLVAESIDEAHRRGASLVTVGIRETGSTLTLTVADDADLATSVSVELADRVGALDGIVEADGNTLRAELPCA
jgi:signal transduction histidine kinase